MVETALSAAKVESQIMSNSENLQDIRRQNSVSSNTSQVLLSARSATPQQL